MAGNGVVVRAAVGGVSWLMEGNGVGNICVRFPRQATLQAQSAPSMTENRKVYSAILTRLAFQIER